jgi:ABC-type transporter Mla subunit MlaD
LTRLLGVLLLLLLLLLLWFVASFLLAAVGVVGRRLGKNTREAAGRDISGLKEGQRHTAEAGACSIECHIITSWCV